MNGLLVFGLIAAVSCNDLIQGPEGGKKIYDENKEASPAIWRRNDEFTFKANETDVIRRIVITDLRPDKDGEAKIIEGGQGQKNVTVQLKSPTALRGYDFHIEVYAVAENGREIYESEVTTELAYPEVTMYAGAPVMENDTNINAKSENVTASDKSMTEDREILSGQEKVPILTGREAKNVKINDPIAQYVNENKTGMISSEKSAPLKSYSLVLPSYHESNEDMKEETTTVHDKTNNEKDITVVPMHGLHPHLLNKEDENIKTTKHTYTTDKLSEHDLKNFQSISKELGENVVFGIKRV